MYFTVREAGCLRSDRGGVAPESCRGTSLPGRSCGSWWLADTFWLLLRAVGDVCSRSLIFEAEHIQNRHIVLSDYSFCSFYNSLRQRIPYSQGKKIKFCKLIYLKILIQQTFECLQYGRRSTVCVFIQR